MKLLMVTLACLVSPAAFAGPQAKPDDARSHLERGIALWQKRDLDGAIGECCTAIRLAPSHIEAHYNLNVALEQKGEGPGALAEKRKAAELDQKK